VSDSVKASFQSLLGGVAWLTQTMLPICVYVAHLQRHLQAPQVQHVKQINRLLKWIKSTLSRLGVRYTALGDRPVRLAVITDSAFQALEFEGLAMRGCVLMLVAADRPPTSTGLTLDCVVLDWFSRKQVHVVRSTFAAELHAMMDAVGQALLLNASITEILEGGLDAAQLAKRSESGDLQLAVDVYVDAKSVMTALAANPVKVPAEKTLYLHLLACRPWIDRGMLASLVWIDTLAMLADGLTKGKVDRSALFECSADNKWQVLGLAPELFKAPVNKGTPP
jgi:hypothetical protein